MNSKVSDPGVFQCITICLLFHRLNSTAAGQYDDHPDKYPDGAKAYLQMLHGLVLLYEFAIQCLTIIISHLNINMVSILES